MSVLPIKIGPMQLKTSETTNKAVKYLGYNWFLCNEHRKAIQKIKNSSQEAFVGAHLYKKSYHMLMMGLEVIPLFGLAVAHIEALWHRVSEDEFLRIDNKININLYTSFDMPNVDNIKELAKLVANDPDEFDKLSEDLKTNKYFANLVVKEDGRSLARFPKEIQENEVIALQAVKQNIEAFSYVGETFKTDAKFLLNCIYSLNETRESHFFDTFVPEKLKYNYLFALKAVARDPRIYGSLCEEFKKQKQLILVAMKNHKNWADTVYLLQKYAKNFKKMPENLQHDLPFVLKILAKNGLVLQFLEKKQKSDPTYALRAIKNNYVAYQYVDEELGKDENFFLDALKINPKIYEFASLEIKKRKDLLLKVMKTQGDMYAFALPEFKIQRDVAIASMKGLNGDIKVIHPTFNEDLELFLLALDQINCHTAIMQAGPGLRMNRTFVLKAIRTWFGSLDYADESFKKDKDIVLEAVKKDGAAFKYAHDTLRQDKAFIIQVIKEGTSLNRIWYGIEDDFKSDPEVKAAYDARKKENRKQDR